MKKIALAFATLSLIACSSEPATPQEQAKANFNKLNEICGNQYESNASAANYIVYSGYDDKRKYKELLVEGQDQADVSSTCYKINTIASGSKGEYTIEGVSEETESEGTWYILNVKYTKTNKTAQFAFLDINGTMALADID